MEASEALAGGESGQTGGEAQAGEQQPAEIPQAIADRFDQLGQSFSDQFGQLQEALEQSRQPEYGDQQYGQQGESELYLNPQGQIVDAYGNVQDPQQLAQEAQQGQVSPEVLQGLQQQMQAQMQEQLAPIMEYFHDQQAAQLEEKYQDFRDEKYAESIVSEAQQKAEQFGMPELGGQPGFIELTHLARVGAQRAAGQETPAGASETGVRLETDGVTNAGQNEVDPGDRIVAAAAGKNTFFNS